MLIIPHRIPSSAVNSGRSTTCVCPFCEAARSDDEVAIDWVEVSLPAGASIMICLGCCIDIFNTCRVEAFADYPYSGIVADAARKVALTVNEFRVHCLREQLAILERRPENYRGEANERLKQRLVSLLASLQVVRQQD